MFGKAINENPEEYFTEDMLHQLELAAEVEFKYGQLEEAELEEVEEHEAA